jgi:hypothetical protein
MGDYGTPLFLFFFFFFSLLSHPQVFASSSTEGRSSVEHVPMTTTSVGLMRCQRQDPLCQLSMMHVIHSMMFSLSPPSVGTEFVASDLLLTRRLTVNSLSPPTRFV